MLPKTLPLILAASLAAPALAQDAAPLMAEVKSPDGAALGTVTATATPSGLMLLTLEFENLPEGIHGVHIHESGACTAPDFESAGGHLAEDKDHGVMAGNGPHPGDLPNIHVPQSGALTVEYFSAGLTAEALADEDGSAFVIHGQPDDYVGQPSCHAGARIGCGVFAAAE